ncbi:MAG: hypothetical protein MZV70_76935 [Desulfobacterales bacterium]|nr:hypothetical protein [Desulfobacterales bacterium]
MVGFIVPNYKIEDERKGGFQWFEESAEYLLKGCKQGVTEEEYPEVAKKLFGRLAAHDKYWKSPEFVEYLETLEPNPAVNGIIEGVKQLQQKEVAFGREQKVQMYGIFSP